MLGRHAPFTGHGGIAQAILSGIALLLTTTAVTAETVRVTPGARYILEIPAGVTSIELPPGSWLHWPQCEHHPDAQLCIDPENGSGPDVRDARTDAPAASQRAPESPAPVALSTERSSSEPAADLVQTLINDMALTNDEALKNHRRFGWARVDLPGFVVRGPNNRGKPYLLPWFTFMEGVSNTYDKVQLKLRNMQVWVLANGTWRQTHGHHDIGGAHFPQSGNYFENGQRHFSGDSVAFIKGLNAHGWWGGREEVGAVQGVVVALQARMIGNDAARARFLMTVGADWYPIRNGASDVILESVGISRAKYVSDQWQWVTMTTFSDVGVQEPGGGISTAELARNLPPLEQ